MGKSITELFSSLAENERQALGSAAPQYWPPMTARRARKVFSDTDWLFERKLDGVRCLTVCQGGQVHLYDRSGKLLDNIFPPIVEALQRLPEDSVLDGEIVAFERKQTRRELLEPYFNPVFESADASSDDARPNSKLPECWYYLFDLLQLGQYDLRNLPLVTRKKILRHVIRFSKPLQFTNHRRGEGERLFDIACRKGWEGIIAKRADSPYRSARSRDWLKFRCDQHQELVIGGYTRPQGSRRQFSELLMGFFEGNNLRYAGKVASGFEGQTQDLLKQAMDRHRQQRSPFCEPIGEKNCHWLSPQLICDVSFAEWTRDRKLSEPRYLGLKSSRNTARARKITPGAAA